MPVFDVEWASTFAKQEREDTNNKVNIYVYGLLTKTEYDKRATKKSKRRIEAEYV